MDLAPIILLMRPSLRPPSAPLLAALAALLLAGLASGGPIPPRGPGAKHPVGKHPVGKHPVGKHPVGPVPARGRAGKAAPRKGPAPARRVAPGGPTAARGAALRDGFPTRTPPHAQYLKAARAVAGARAKGLKGGKAGAPGAAKVAGRGAPKVSYLAVKGMGAPRGAARRGPGAEVPAAPVVLAKAGPAALERKAVQAKYDAMSLLVMRRDGAGLTKLFLGMTSRGFVFVDKKGRRFGRGQLVAQLKAQMRAVKRFQRSGNRVTAFAVRGSTAQAGVVSDFAMVFPPSVAATGAKGAKGAKGATIAGQSTTRDTWRKEAGGWKLVSIRTLKESVKIDGKPM